MEVVYINIHTCAITGHHPREFAFGYDEEHHACQDLKRAIAAQIEQLIERQAITAFYVCMELGAGMWAAEILLDFKKAYPGLEIYAVVPNEEQASRWSATDRERYFQIHQQCNDVFFTCKHYHKDCMFDCIRDAINRAMYFFAVFNGDAQSYTGFAVQYAREQERRIYTMEPERYEVTTPADREAVKRRRAFALMENDKTE